MPHTSSEKRREILDATGHTLVTGGPGSGKTTIALRKALKRIEEGILPGQSVLCLSFSREAVARILTTAREQIPKASQSLLSIQTFHSFFWEILRGHGYLLGSPKHLSLLAPQDERALSNGLKGDENDPRMIEWFAERERIFRSEGRIAFDLFAPKASELLSRCSAIRRVYGERFPLIIVDEAQDTSLTQWMCINCLSDYSQVLCLADLDQQIYDFLPGVGPERIRQIESELSPLKIDLGSENHRSPNSEILAFGNEILAGVSRAGSYAGISQINYNPSAEQRDKSIRESVGRTKRLVTNSTGHTPASIGFFATSDRGAALISKALHGGPYPISHRLLFDESATLLSSRFLAFLLEPKDSEGALADLAQALELLSMVFRSKGTKGGLATAANLQSWATDTLLGKTPNRKLFKQLALLLTNLQSVRFCGNPAKDWTSVRQMLHETGVSELKEIDQSLEYLMAFNRGKRHFRCGTN
jgi:DNA helicase II / ATP-dependent DNA helicase PcrA